MVTFKKYIFVCTFTHQWRSSDFPRSQIQYSRALRKPPLSCHISWCARFLLLRWNHWICTLAFLCQTSQGFFISTVMTTRGMKTCRLQGQQFDSQAWSRNTKSKFYMCNCDIVVYLYFSLSDKHFKVSSCQRTEQMCHAATDCINQICLYSHI